ncbi:MAG TPA: hypothetical protein PLJ35_05180 [Anaerolineae bacterium]|nr:hypothetical protein [Anaerolineae bacterium]
MTTTDQVAAILQQAALAIEFAAAKIAGLPSCICGRQQYTKRGVYIAQDAIGGGFSDTDPDVGELILETACIMCGCYCHSGGEIVPLPRLDLDFAGAEVAPHEDVSMAGVG